MRIRPSNRAGWDLTPNAFSAACQRRIREGQQLLDLVQSNPTRIGLDTLTPVMLDALRHPASTRYEPNPLGIPCAREAVASWYARRGLAVNPDRLMLTASSSEAYGTLLKLLCDPGDSILVPAPSYPLFDQLARLEGVTVKRYPLMMEDGWRVCEAMVQQVVDSRTRAIFAVSPNNPTGSYLHSSELRSIERVAREHNLAVVCDEVFAEYVWKEDTDRVVCAALEADVPTFSLGGLSKSACLPQMKLGWIVMGEHVDQDTIHRLEMIADTYLSVSTPIQHAAGAFLDGATLARDMLAQRIQENLAVLEHSIRATPVSVLPIDGGWYACLRVPSVMSDEQWAELLVLEDGVVVHPGSFFGFPIPGILVIGLIAPTHVFREGIQRLVARGEKVIA